MLRERRNFKRAVLLGLFLAFCFILQAQCKERQAFSPRVREKQTRMLRVQLSFSWSLLELHKVQLMLYLISCGRFLLTSIIQLAPTSLWPQESPLKTYNDDVKPCDISRIHGALNCELKTPWLVGNPQGFNCFKESTWRELAYSQHRPAACST